MTPRSIKRLEDARDACVRVRGFLRGITLDAFLESELLRSAVERQLEIIGEALGIAAREDETVQQLIPDIPKIIGLRNRLIHGNDTVDPELLWDLIRTNVPRLQKQLEEQLSL